MSRKAESGFLGKRFLIFNLILNFNIKRVLGEGHAFEEWGELGLLQTFHRHVPQVLGGMTFVVNDLGGFQ